MKTFNPAKLLALAAIGLYAIATVTMAIPARAAILGSPSSSEASFCARFNTIGGSILSRLNMRGDNLGDHQDTTLGRIQAARLRFDAQLKADRARWTDLRNQQYQALMAKANTSAQKSAVTQYRDTVETAITARQDAVDTAIAMYRSAADAGVSSRQGDVDAIATKFKTQVQTAIDNAQSSCDAGTSPVVVRQAFVDAIANAQKDLSEARAGVEKIRTNIQLLDQTKRKSIDAAINQFKQTAEAAAKSLEAAMKSQNSQMGTNG